MRNIVLIDFLWLCDSSYWGFRDFKTKAPYVTSYSKVTSHLYGALHFLNLSKLYNTSDIILCLDRGTAGRTGEQSTYKQGRSSREYSTTETLEYFKTLGLATAHADGYEADDVAFSLANYLVDNCEEPVKIILFSGDDDWIYNLRHPNVSIRRSSAVKAGEMPVESYMEKKYHNCPPKALVLWKALRGDTSDNIKSVRGFSNKSASILCKEYTHFDADFILEEMEAAPETLLEKGVKSADIVRLLGNADVFKSNIKMVSMIDCYDKISLIPNEVKPEEFEKLTTNYEFDRSFITKFNSSLLRGN